VFPGAVGSPFWLQHQRAMDEGAPAEFEEYSALLATWFAVRAYPSEGGLSVFLSDVTERRALLARERASAARARGLAALAEGLTAAVDAEAVARVAVEQARVSGKGTEAAVLNGMARNMIRAITLRERDPVTILASLNAAILQHGDGERFCTVVLATLRPDGDGWALTLASAGHPPPLVLRTDGGIEAVPVRGDLLGLFGDVHHERAEVRLAPGDAIVFHTDGITEARRGEELFGDERLRAAVQQARGVDAEALADRIESVVQDFARGVPRDDEAVVVLRVSPRP